MNLEKAETLAKALIKEHLSDTYDFKWGKAKKTFGVCYYPMDKRKGYIRLSSILVALNTEEHVKDTILHEIAHAIVGFEAGHGKEFKRVAKRLGCTSLTAAKAGRVPDPAYVLYSPKTGNILKKWARRPNKQTFNTLEWGYERGARDLTLGTLQILTWGEYNAK